MAFLLRKKANRSPFLLLSSLTILLCGCSAIQGVAEKEDISHLKIYYIPWEMSTQARWTEPEVRDTSISYVSFYCTQRREAIQAFSSIFDSTSWKLQPSIEGVPAYMLIDIFYHSGRRKKLTIGDSIFMEYAEDIYRVSPALRKWIDRFVPSAAFPLGNKLDSCYR